jgi:Xaa-Pro aminopeptidase
MIGEQEERIRLCLKEMGADWAILSGPDAVCYATGQPIPIETGPSPFTGGPALAFVGRSGGIGLVCSNVEASGPVPGVTLETYAGFSETVTDQLEGYRGAVQRMARRLGVGGKLAVQLVSHPASVVDILPLGPSIDPLLNRVRAVKTMGEITALRLAATSANDGQRAARRLSCVGLSELEILNGIRAAIEDGAGSRCALAGEYVTGIERTATLGNPPGRRKLISGDPVICDLAPRVGGYWSDSCASFCIDSASDVWLAQYQRAKETLDLAIATLRPGISVANFDKTLRAHMQEAGFSYPHHSGHGIGTSVHEWPRLVPDEPTLIEENMVLMVEPGSYLPGIGGARCEHMLRVTATGAEVLTNFLMEPVL